MSFSRGILAAIAATVVYFLLGGLVFAIAPMRREFASYPQVYRSPESMKPVAPIGLVAMFVAMLILVRLFGMSYPAGANVAAGASFGGLIGLFAACAFVLHNYVNLNIGMRLTIGQAVASLVEWTVAGVVIALIYR